LTLQPEYTINKIWRAKCFKRITVAAVFKKLLSTIYSKKALFKNDTCGCFYTKSVQIL
jgi:hypothetical protein